MSVSYIAYCGICVSVLKELNNIVDEPYMDEPFHIPQAQAYCQGDFAFWDPKITTPPGLYIMSLVFKRIFMFKCSLPMLRLTTALTLLALPIALTRLSCFYQRIRPPPLLNPVPVSIVLSTFPIAWFFGFLYYTEVPSLIFVIATVVAAGDDRHWLAALLGLLSCTFRQTNVIWTLYAYATSQLIYLKYRRPRAGSQEVHKLHDPPADQAGLVDLYKSVLSLPGVLPDIVSAFVPYALVLAVFSSFVVWNGGIVLGDKSNHIPVLHVPQFYYFFAFSTAFGWPVLISGDGGIMALLRNTYERTFGSKFRSMITAVILAAMLLTVKLYTIHHPFLLSDNRHYTFYVWHRIYMLHWIAPYLLVPAYLACACAWFLRVGNEQSMLQTMAIPLFTLVTLLPTPLLEPRYFLIPYLLMRIQIVNVPSWALVLEGMWYAAINFVTMGVFLYLPREGVGRFMW
ncbi:glucosyltransferase [Rhodocollybia butyracea]|uniref:Dol-P-Glc:Glc(2)Man(9)GlcNAc(2)-PP-Dol alpha-1,2-glucosyltransferase n=1 Tax=Rhodocollybia butyracea TaxID=206335 RepID=A0A9P5UB58_9AGAR|nr:glucosyltransferase [Rhodocollybia butyracea]